MAWVLLSAEEDRGETGGNRGEKIFPSQLSFQRERKFAMVDLNTFSIISKQEVSPAAVFSVEEGGLPLFHAKGQMLHTIFASDFWPENKNWHYKCPIILSNLPWHSMTGLGGSLFVLFKWLYSCCCVLRLTIRTYWPFFQECRALKRQRGDYKERTKRGPSFVFEYLCSLT